MCDFCENSAGYLVVLTIMQSRKTGETWSAEVKKKQWDQDGGIRTYPAAATSGNQTFTADNAAAESVFDRFRAGVKIFRK